MKQKKKAYFHASCSELSRQSDAEAKKADLQKLWKTQCFCAFFEYQLMSIKHKDDVTTMPKKHEKIITGIIDS